ncbi:JmjC domain-containing protein [Kitasatospora sp. McL0602]|uniref:JmjC domain-containing protein n=1 Tax=Kitasatospora sp. McL0602 TaxID=3439530 RepID=UPI003F8C9178
MSLSLLLDPELSGVLNSCPTEPQFYHHHPDRFAGLLLHREELDALIDTNTLASRNIVLLKDGGPVDPCLYVVGDMPRQGYIRRFLNDGGTLSVRALDQMKPMVADMARAIAAETGYEVHANAYYTPAGAHGLRYHYDPYVTLIVQLSGQKAWPLHRPFVENPVREYGSFHTRGFTPDERKFLEHTPPEETPVLKPGDVMWLPRGFVHSPYTVGDEPSLHLTFALKERTGQWVASEVAGLVLRQALADPAMRAALAPEALHDPAGAVKEARAYLVGALARADIAELADAVRRAAHPEPFPAGLPVAGVGSSPTPALPTPR